MCIISTSTHYTKFVRYSPKISDCHLVCSSWHAAVFHIEVSVVFIMSSNQKLNVHYMWVPCCFRYYRKRKRIFFNDFTFQELMLLLKWCWCHFNLTKSYGGLDGVTDGRKLCSTEVGCSVVGWCAYKISWIFWFRDY